jgi:hypothetical protein
MAFFFDDSSPFQRFDGLALSFLLSLQIDSTVFAIKTRHFATRERQSLPCRRNDQIPAEKREKSFIQRAIADCFDSIFLMLLVILVFVAFLSLVP